MYLQKLALLNFKNYETLSLDFCPTINCLVGDNGSGKTNLLDAIHYLSMSKSAFNAVDTQNIRHEEQYFTVQGEFQLTEASHHVLCGVQKGRKKVLRLDKKEYDKLSEHIGRFPTVMIAPQDSSLILEGSETRRKYFDSLISQLDAAYLQYLIQYNHYLKQRNSLLKQFAERNYMDRDLIQTYDGPMIKLGQKIFERRQAFVQDFLPTLEKHYQHISDCKEAVKMIYQSQLMQPDHPALFRQNLRKDIQKQRSTFGIHRDDYQFEINGFPLKKYGSQGQQKSFLIALKLAHFEYISQQKQRKAILLLDDIFDKLDDKRMNKLIQMVAAQTFGQIFLTDARPERSKQILSAVDIEKKIYTLSAGVVEQQEVLV